MDKWVYHSDLSATSPVPGFSGRERSMSGYVARGPVGCPSQPGPWAAGVLLESGRWRLSYPGRPKIWLGMRLAGAMSISVLRPSSAAAVSCHLGVVSLCLALEPAQSVKALQMPPLHPCSHNRSSIWVLCHP